MNIVYRPSNFSAHNRQIIDTANDILAQSETPYTVRQLYYQLVIRHTIPNNHLSYKRLKATLTNARLAGLIPWSMIEDRTRELKKNRYTQNLNEIIENYRIDMWENQVFRPIILLEKDALISSIAPICSALDVAYLSTRGYCSLSTQHELAQMINQSDQQIVILCLSDHDPSGLDLERDHADKLELFGADVAFKRIGLTTEQIQTHGLPSVTVKPTDQRAFDYTLDYGDQCWELDALAPHELAKTIEAEVLCLRDEPAYQTKLLEWHRGREKLKSMIKA